MHAGATARYSVAPATFRPHRALGVIVGGAFALWAGFIAFVAFSVADGAAVEAKTFLAWCVAGAAAAIALAFLYWTAAVAMLAYEVDDHAVTIRWGFRQIVVPLTNIQRMVPGRTLTVASVSGISWWGCHVGVATVERIGRTLFFSTHNTAEDLLYVVTPGEAYALAVTDQAAFAEEVQARVSLGPAIGTMGVQASHPTHVARLTILRDRVGLGALAVAALGCAALAGYVFTNYPGLPAIVELNFPEFGEIVRIGDKSELLRIAYVGAGILAVNTVLGILLHSWERAAGVWLLLSAGMLQLVLLAAAVAAFARA